MAENANVKTGIGITKTGNLDRKQFESMKVADLKQLASDMGVDIAGNAKKEDTVSEWLPLLAFEYQMPEIGALVATFLDDERGNGICFGKIYSNEQKPPANVGYKKIVDGMEITKKDNVFSVKFDDNNYIRFSGGTMTIKADKVNIIDNTEG